MKTHPTSTTPAFPIAGTKTITTVPVAKPPGSFTSNRPAVPAWFRCLWLLTLALALPLVAQAQFDYSVANGQATITGYTGPGGEVVIPDLLGGYPVTAIGFFAFNGLSTLTRVILPNSVTSIGQGAFYGCSSLTNISVTAGNPAFSSVSGVLFNKLQTTLNQFPPGLAGSYVIPNSVPNIGIAAFQSCTSLTSVILPNSVTSIGLLAFEGCSSLTDVTLPNSVTNLGDFAFSGCSSLTSVTLPDGLANIPQAAFQYCTSLANVAIPDSVTNIESDAFWGCSSLAGVIFPNSLTTIEGRAFVNCSSLTNVTLPDSVTNLGFAFLDCSSLTNISVTAGNPVFSSESGVLFNKLQTTLILCPPGLVGSYVIPDSVTFIGDASFATCSSLTSVTFPDSVMNFGYNVFESCSSLTNISATAGNPVFSSESGVLFNKLKTTLIEPPPGLAGSYVIPDSVTTIEDAAFTFCSSLTSVTLPNSVTRIGDFTFYNCTSLASVTIPNSVTSIGDYAFGYCAGLTAAYFQGNTPAISDSAFAGDDLAKVYYLTGTWGWGATYGGRPTVQWDPRILTGNGLFGVQAGHFGFTFMGAANVHVAIEACPDLAQPNWTTLAHLICDADGQVQFTDPEAADQPARYYSFRPE